MSNFRNLKDKSFIIAEVGQNHQGNLSIAKKYIEVFSALGADAIKFQTRDNKNLFSKACNLIIAAEMFCGALIIFKGLSSFKTNFKASSSGGT